MRAHQHSKCWLLMAVSVKCHCCFSQPLWAVGTVFFIPSLEHGNNLHFNWKCVTIPKAYGLVYVAHLQLTCSSLLTVRKLLQSISMSHYLVYFFIVVSSFIQTVVIKCCMLDILRRKINFAQSFGSRPCRSEVHKKFDGREFVLLSGTKATSAVWLVFLWHCIPLHGFICLYWPSYNSYLCFMAVTPRNIMLLKQHSLKTKQNKTWNNLFKGK